MQKFLLTISLIILSYSIRAQVGIGTNTPDASAALDIVASANDKGVLIPRLTRAQRNAISSPATGLLIYQTDNTAGLYYFNGSNWIGFGEVRSVNGQSPSVVNGNVAITLLPTQTGTQAQRTATVSLTDGLIHIVTGDPTPGEDGKVYIYSTATSSWNITSAFTDTDEQDISGSTFDSTTNQLTIGITGGMSQTLSLSTLANTDSQTLTLSGTTLSLTNGGAVTLSSGSTNTDSQTLTLAGQVLTISAGNSVTLAETDSQTLSLVGQVLTISGGNSVTLADSNTDTQTLSLAGNVLAISGGNSVTLTETDSQTLSLVGQVLSISAGNSVTLTDTNTDSQTLTLAGQVLTISAGNSVTLAETDSQTLSLVGQVLTISSGNSVTLADTNTDTQTLSLAGNVLAISGGNSVTLTETDSQTLSLAGQVLSISAGNSVTLTDTNTDSQTLTLAGQVLTISAGNSVTLAETDSQTLSLVGQVLTISGGNSVTLTETDSQTLSLVGQVLSISAGNSVTLTDTNTDSQTLTLAGQVLTISAGNSVTLAETDSQTLSLVGQVLTISGGNSVTLADSNTDTQTLSLAGNVLAISGGNSVTLTETDSQTLSLVGQVLSISAGNSVTLTDTNTDSQTLTLAGQVLTISAGNSVTLTDTNTDTQTLSFISDVLTISGGNSVTIRSLPFTVSDGNTLAWNGTTNQWNAVNDLRVPVAVAADPIQIFKSLVPANSTAELGQAANAFEKVFTKEIRSDTSSLVFNTGVTSLTVPQIVFEQGSTQIGGFGQNRFFLGNFAGGDYYIFPSTTVGANNNDILTYNGSNALSFSSIQSLEQQDLDDVVSNGGTTTRTVAVGNLSVDGDLNASGGDINLGTSLSNDTIEIGNSNLDTVVINATLSSTLEVANSAVNLGTNSQELGTVYVQNIDANSADLEFKRGGNTFAGIDTSNNFFIGATSATGYSFPRFEPATVGNQVLAYTSSNTLDFLTITQTDSQTLSFSGQVLTISGGNSVTLADTNTDTQTLSLAGNVLAISGGNSVTLTQTDSQTLSLSGQVLTISGGNSVTLADTNTDSQTISGSFAANTLNLWNQGTTSSATVDLSSLANTDTQTLAQVTAQGTITTDAIQVAGLTVSGTTGLTVGEAGDQFIFPTTQGTAGQVLTVSTTTGELVFADKTTNTDTQTLAQVTAQGTITTDAIQVAGLTVSGTIGLTVGEATNQYLFPVTRGTAGQVLTVSSTSTGTLVFQSVTGTITPVYKDESKLNVIIMSDPSTSILGGADDNTALGFEALDNITSGSWNTAIGAETLDNLTTGFANVGIGFRSLWTVTTSYYNTAVGFSTLQNLSTSGTQIRNTALGYNAGNILSIGDENVFIGADSGDLSYTANKNTFIGTESGPNNGSTLRTGDENVSLGYRAGYFLGNGDNNIYIGSNAGPTSSTNEDNQMYIGNSDIVDTTLFSDTVELTGTLSINTELSTSTLTFPSTQGSTGQVLTVSSTTSALYFANATTNTDTQTIAAALNGTTLELRPENITTASITVDLSSLAVTPTLDQVTDVGSITTNNIQVGDLTTTGLTVGNYTFPASNTFGANVALVSTATDTIGFRPFVNIPSGTNDGDILFWNSLGANWERTDILKVPISGAIEVDETFRPRTNGDKLLGTSSYVFSETYSKAFRSGSSAMEIKTGVTSGLNPALSILESSTLVAGVVSQTFFIGDFPGGTGYSFPTTQGTAGQALTVSTTTGELVFADKTTNTDTQTLAQVTAQGTITTDSIQVAGLTVSGTTGLTIGEAGDQFIFPTNQGTSGQVLTVSTTTGELVFADKTTNTDSQTISGSLSGNTLNLWNQGTTTSATVDLSAIANTDTQTLAQVTAQGSQTTDTIQVGGIMDLGIILVAGDAGFQSNVTLGSDPSNTISFSGKVDTSIYFNNDASEIGDATNALSTIFTQNVKSSTSNDLYLDTNDTGDQVVFANNGIARAGVNSTTFYVGDYGSLDYYLFPTTRGSAGQVLTVSNTTGELVFANKTTNTDSQTISGSLSGNTLNLWNQGTTTSATVDLSAIANTDTQTLAQVTAEGATTTRTITVGGMTSTGDVSIEGNTTLGNSVSDSVAINGKVSTSILPINSTRTLGDASNIWNSLFVKEIRGDATETSPVSIRSGSDYVAGITTDTFFIGDLTGSDYYKFPAGDASPTAGQVLTVSSTTTELYFSTIPTLPAGMNEGNTLRWNATANEWERTTDLRIAPGSGFSPNNAIWINQSLIPSSTSLSLGQSGNEFRDAYTNSVRTSQNALRLETNSQNIYLKRDSDNLIVQDDNTSIASSNQYNVAFGPDAFNSSSTGANYNTAIGYQVLSSLTSGDENIGLGDGVMTLITTGSQNTGVGANALQNIINNVSGNTAVGYSSGLALTTGTYNVALGYEALLGDGGGGGDYNIAIGYRAMYNDYESNNNVAIGRRSLFDIDDGDENIGLGTSSLFSVTAGNNNIGIGYNAGDTITAGADNILIGTSADVTSASVTNTIGIGKNVSISSSNEIIIGNSDHINTTLGGTTIKPFLDNSTDLGTSSRRFKNLYTKVAAITDGLTADEINVSNDVTVGGNLNVDGDIEVDQDVVAVGDMYATSFIDSSDKRLKSNILPISVGLNTILKLNPLEYTKFNNTQKTGKSRFEYGFIAQEVQLLIPEIVRTINEEEQLLGISYDAVVPILTKAIQEQQAQIEAQQQQLNTQATEIETLKTLVQQLINKQK